MFYVNGPSGLSYIMPKYKWCLEWKPNLNRKAME